MKKSFKRILASFLAALMIVFAAPFTASACSTYVTGADKTPNWGLIFNAFTFKNTYFNYSETATNLNNKGIKEMPLEYNANAKTITARKATADTSGLSSTTGTTATTKRYKKTADYTLQDGDYFFLTISLDNVGVFWGAGLELAYTGCEPAGIVSINYVDPDTEDEISTICFEDDPRVQICEDNGGSVETWAEKGIPIASLSAGSAFYGSNSVMKNFDVASGSTFEDTYIAFGVTSDNDSDDVSSIPTPATAVATCFKCPECGAQKYNYSYRAPMATYVFKVTDNDNITFDLHNDESYLAYDFNQQSLAEQLTYLPSEYPGSMGMDFMGSNKYRQTPVVTYPTVTIKTPDGDLTYTADATTTTYTVPSLDTYAQAPDGTNHYTVAWKDGNVPSGTFGSTDETFEIVRTAEAHTFTDVTDPAATCTTAGTITHTCDTCQYQYTSEDPINPNAHAWGNWAIDENTWATVTDNQVQANNSATVNVKRTCDYDETHVETDAATVAVTAFTASTEQAGGSVTFTATYDGNVVGTKTEEFEALPHSHVWSAEKVATGVREEATCTAAGFYEVDYQCTVCDAFKGEAENVVIPVDADAHPNAAIENRAKEEATCEEAGHEAGTYCTACNTWVTGGEAIPAKNHDYTGAIDINWAKEGDEWTATGVQHCKNDASHTTAVNVTVNKVVTPAEKGKDGSIVWTAYVDGVEQDSKSEVIPALKVTVTVGAADMGTVVGDIPSNGAAASKEFNLGQKFNIQAVPADGATFLGWEMNGKIVSKETAYSGVAYTDTLITPVYQDATEGNISVFFYDKYGNVIKEFKDVSVADYQAAVAEAVPEGNNFPGYTFAGYEGVTYDDIKANTESTTYWAVYEKNDTALYTVNAPGATIEAAAGDVDGSTATNVPYDTKVTVTSDSAKAWKIGDDVVAYGTSYSFYVGSDVTVVPVAEDTEVKTNVAILGVTANKPSYSILATRTAGNATIVERGWIYGTKDDDSIYNDIDKAVAPNSGVRVKRGPVTSSEQFSLTIKINNAGTTVKVAAFVVDSNGNITYSAPTEVVGQ